MTVNSGFWAGAALGLAMLVAASGAHAATGLNGAYYAFSVPGPTSGGPGSVSQALADIASASGPTATFIATSVCFPSCGGQLGDSGASVADFLGAGNYTSLSPNSVTDLSNHAVLLTGYVDILTAGTYNFSLESDDGSAFWIDTGTSGTPLINNDFDHGLNTVPGSITLTAGYHAIEILQFEDGGVTGLTFSGSGPGAVNFTTGIPEPATWAMSVLGLFALGGVLRSSRRKLALQTV